jgi:hypothetical protein
LYNFWDKISFVLAKPAPTNLPLHLEFEGGLKQIDRISRNQQHAKPKQEKQTGLHYALLDCGGQRLSKDAFKQQKDKLSTI